MHSSNAATPTNRTPRVAVDQCGGGAEPSLAGLVRVLAGLSVPHRDPATAKRQLLDGVAGLIDADTWTWALTRTPAPADPDSLPVPLALLDGGWTPAQKSLHVRAQQSPLRAVFKAGIVRAFDRDGHATVARPDLLDDAAWRACPYYQSFAGPMGLDEFLFSSRHLNAGDVSSVAFYRGVARPPFDAASKALVRVLMRDIPWLHHDGTPAAAADPMVTLSPRERQVLNLLQAGDGRKQIAAKLGISQHTVGGYLKAIYRHYDVTSRGELQARFFAGRATDGRTAGGASPD